MSESSADIRKRLSHPIIDIDGHMDEYFPALAPYLEREGLSLDHPSLQRMLPPYGGTTKRRRSGSQWLASKHLVGQHAL